MKKEKCELCGQEKLSTWDNIWVPSFLGLMLFLAGVTGWQLHPDTKEVVVVHSTPESRKFCEDLGGSTGGGSTVGVNTPLCFLPKEISILAEKKKCDALGAKFAIMPEVPVLRFTEDEGYAWSRENSTKIVCTRPYSTTTPNGTVTGTETLFEHVISE